MRLNGEWQLDGRNQVYELNLANINKYVFRLQFCFLKIAFFFILTKQITEIFFANNSIKKKFRIKMQMN